MVGPRHLVTASHCVLEADGDLATSGWWSPGQTETQTPNGGPYRWRGLSLRDWRNGAKWDYALLYLDDNPAVATLGWFGMAYWTSASSYVGRTTYQFGYPCGNNLSCGSSTTGLHRCKASPDTYKRCDGWMYGDATTLQSGASTSDDRLKGNYDSTNGQSGMILYTFLGSKRAVLAVHKGLTGGLNGGPRLRSSMYNDLCTWIGIVNSIYGTDGLCGG